MLVSRNQLLFAFSESLDYVESIVGSHHYDTAYIALSILNEMDLSDESVQEIVTAAVIHDVGVFSKNLYGLLKNYDFEDESRHAEIGYSLLNKIHYYSNFAETILYHHHRYDQNLFSCAPLSSQIVFLSDRLTFLIEKSPADIAIHKKYILDKVSDDMGKRFNPALFPFLERALEKNSFWANYKNGISKDIVKASFKYDRRITDHEEIKNFLILFGKITDYKSSFTAAHTTGVSRIAREIGKLYGLAHNPISDLEIAGLVHDIGKLAVDKNLLEKNSSLTDEEFETIKSHILYSHKILSKISGFKHIAQIACSHHERIDGSGYPNRRTGKDLSTEEKILMTADIFTALSENRPYRPAMKKDTVIKVLKDMELKKKICGRINATVIHHIDHLYNLNTKIQKQAYKEYQDLNFSTQQLAL